MEVIRIKEAEPYDAPNHWEVHSLRIQGYNASDTGKFWVGLSTVEPEGGAGPDSTPFEKVYVVVEGELTVTTEENGEVKLGKYDSCRIVPGEQRIMKNLTTEPVKLLVVIPYPESE